jgi:hypothetical protein
MVRSLANLVTCCKNLYLKIPITNTNWVGIFLYRKIKTANTRRENMTRSVTFQAQHGSVRLHGRNNTYRLTPKCMASASIVGNSARQQPKGQPKLGVRTRDLATVCSAASTAGAETGSAIDENSILDTVIVGAGISGLTTALVRLH